MNEDKEVTDICVGNIKEDIERCKELIKDKHKEWIGLTNQKAIANVLEAYEKLQNKLLDTMKGMKIIREETPEYIKVTYIPKQKIKDKIEEYNEEVQEYVEYWRKDPRQFKKETCVSYYKKIALEELLKESEEK